MSIEIIEVRNRAQMRKFVRFPLDLYKNCENWVPALEGDEYDTFNPKVNEAYTFCESICFLAYKDGKIAGRIAGIINHKANEIWKKENVRFGWLDFIEDVDVLKALIDKVITWGKERGCKRIVGPMGFTDMDKEGLLVDGFDRLSPFTCLYNFPYYGEMLEKIGFSKEVDWTQSIVEITDKKPLAFNFSEQIEKRFGIHVCTIPSMRKMNKKYGMEIFHMYNETFVPLYQFTPLTDKQIENYLDTYIPILDHRLVAVCLNDDDKPVGFVFCVPALNKAVKKSKGRLFPFGFIRILRALKKNDTMEALMIGVLPEYQREGAIVLMLKYIHENAQKMGIKYMITNPRLEDNVKAQTLLTEYKEDFYMRRRSYFMDLND